MRKSKGSWVDAVQAQLFFSDKSLKSLIQLEKRNADYKFHYITTLLHFQALWHCWLNEWSTHLAPKEKLPEFMSWESFASQFSGNDGVQAFRQALSNPEGWERAWAEIEGQSTNDWLSQLEREHEDQLSSAVNPLALKQIDVRPLSATQGIDDISQMFDELRAFIQKVREQHTEW